MATGTTGPTSPNPNYRPTATPLAPPSPTKSFTSKPLPKLTFETLQVYWNEFTTHSAIVWLSIGVVIGYFFPYCLEQLRRRSDIAEYDDHFDAYDDDDAAYTDNYDASMMDAATDNEPSSTTTTHMATTTATRNPSQQSATNSHHNHTIPDEQHHAIHEASVRSAKNLHAKSRKPIASSLRGADDSSSDSESDIEMDAYGCFVCRVDCLGDRYVAMNCSNFFGENEKLC